MKNPRKIINKEVLCLLRRTKREMDIEEIAHRTKLTKTQVYNALNNILKPRGLIEKKPREKLKPSKGKPPLGKIKIIMKRDKKTGKIPHYFDRVVHNYEAYKTKNKLW